MSSKEAKKSSSSTLAIVIAVVGIALIIAGGTYALYERYVVGGTRLSTLAFNPLVDALGVIGVVLLIVGVTMYYRMKTPKSPGTPPSQGGSVSPGRPGGSGGTAGQGARGKKPGT